MDNSTNADALFDTALERHEAGSFAQAEALYMQALQLDPEHPGALYYLGRLAFEDGRFEQAFELVAKLTTEGSDDFEAFHLQGLAAHRLDRKVLVIESIEKSIACEPAYAVAHFSLGNILRLEHRLDEARACYERALALDASVPDVFANLALVCGQQGRLFEAEEYLRREIVLRPAADAYDRLGAMLFAQGDAAAAIEQYRAALALQPEFATAHNNLGVALQSQGSVADAVVCYRRAIAANSAFHDAHKNLGSALQLLGDLRGAVEHQRQALALKPDYLDAFHDYLLTCQYLPDFAPADIFAEHLRFAERFEAPLRADWPTHAHIADPRRRLKIGFVSGDLYMHPVGFFLESVLEGVDRQALDVTIYSNSFRSDPLTERLRGLGFGWHSVTGESDAVLARRIRDDGIDILVDLSGHTGDNRLLVFARKPAPVQVSWLGYWNTTGLRAMDYVLTDTWSVPADEARFYVEQPWYLPHTRLCFTAPADEIAVGPLPSLRNGYTTFGCFNNLSKMTDAVVAAWARVLRGADDSKLFLKSKPLATPAIQREVMARFARHGIAAERLILEGASSRASYLQTFDRVDLALDPFPFTGATTTVEGLWMGVPVITRRGDRAIAHQGEGILHNMGLGDWVAADDDAYVELAIARAGDAAGLAALRGQLRERLLASPLCDSSRFARDLEAAFRGMWEQYCATR